MYYLSLFFLLGTAASLYASSESPNDLRERLNRVEKISHQKRKAEKRSFSRLTAAQRNSQTQLFHRIEADRVRKYNEEKSSSQAN